MPDLAKVTLHHRKTQRDTHAFPSAYVTYVDDHLEVRDASGQLLHRVTAAEFTVSFARVGDEASAPED